MKPRRYVVLAYIAPTESWIPMSRRYHTPRAAQRAITRWWWTAALSPLAPPWTELRVAHVDGVLPEQTLGVR